MTHKGSANTVKHSCVSPSETHKQNCLKTEYVPIFGSKSLYFSKLFLSVDITKAFDWPQSFHSPNTSLTLRVSHRHHHHLENNTFEENNIIFPSRSWSYLSVLTVLSLCPSVSSAALCAHSTVCFYVCVLGYVWLSWQRQSRAEPEEGRRDLPAAANQRRLAWGENRETVVEWEGRESGIVGRAGGEMKSWGCVERDGRRRTSNEGEGREGCTGGGVGWWYKRWEKKGWWEWAQKKKWWQGSGREGGRGKRRERERAKESEREMQR